MGRIQTIDPVILKSTLDNRLYSIDMRYRPDGRPKPVILHVHGFKGFKDWGYFNQLANRAAMAGFVFFKMNFSHNGTTPEHPVDFVDLEAFGSNNFSIEQRDMGQVIDLIFSDHSAIDKQQMDLNRFFLTGHSRGGAAVLLKGYHDKRVKAIASWAGINDLSNYFSHKEVEEWKEKGVVYIENSRTRQLMPLYYQIVEDYLRNENSFNVPDIIRKLIKPALIVHGSGDTTVPVEVAYQTKSWNQNVVLHILEGSDHVFGGGHPWKKNKLPPDAVRVIDTTLEFFRSVTDQTS